MEGFVCPKEATVWAQFARRDFLSTGQLRAVTKAYSLQAAIEATRNTLLESAFKSELLDTPVRLNDAPSIEHRLETLATVRSVARTQIGLLSSATSAYDIAISTLDDGEPRV
jgi:hypothetical protein